MNVSDNSRDVFNVHADPTPHFTGCYVVGQDGKGMFVGRDEQPYENVNEIRLYTDSRRKDEAILIRSRRMLDVTLVYDVWDSSNGTRIGVIRRMRHRSLLCDEWAVIGCGQNCSPGVASVENANFAVMKRAFCGAVDHRFHVYSGGVQIGSIRERRTQRGRVYIETDFTADRDGLLDRRLGIAAGVVLVLSDWT